VTAPEKTPTPAELWERAGYLRAAYAAASAADAYAAYVDASAAAYAASAAAYAAAGAAYAAAGASVDADAYDAGMARWAREHPPKEGT